MINERKARDVERKKNMVENIHKYEDVCRDKMKMRQESVYKQAKTTHNFKLLDEYMKGEMQKVNKTIFSIKIQS